MGRLAKSDYEELRKARIIENQARLASMGIQNPISELRPLTPSPKSGSKRKGCRADHGSNPLRCSARLRGKSPPPQGELGCLEDSDRDEIGEEKGDLGLEEKSDYEALRKARIFENQARLASLGLQKTISELRSLTSSPKPSKRKWCKADHSSTPLRRSTRLTGKPGPPQGKSLYFEDNDAGENRVRGGRGLRREISIEALARRCGSKGRGSLYDPVHGICCHFCRQKKLCGEEDCKRCGELDMAQPCIGKTDCSICHSSNGILCRACLRVRYGEEMEEVRANKDWICPHCSEDKGINPYWICNSSLCLKKRKMVPTGIAIFRARELGYKSVAHLLMDELQRSEKWRG